MSDPTGNSWADAIAGTYPDLGDFAKLLETIEAESDRGAVLVIGGFLEQQLLELLSGFLIANPSSHGLLEGGFAPLSAFGPRAMLCHALGLINDDEMHDLNLIRRIRNDFAHRLRAGFDDPSIRDRCDTFRIKVAPYFDDDVGRVDPETRVRFTAPAMSLIMTLWFRIREVEDHACEPVRWLRQSARATDPE